MNQKAGRNDPCPCGSGKKYKSCCMLKEKEQAAAKYTAGGKRKFKATVLSAGSGALSVFNRSATAHEAVPEEQNLEKLKLRMTGKDFRTKEESQPLSFEKPSFEKTPEEKELNLPKPDEEFKPTTHDFREKNK